MAFKFSSRREFSEPVTYHIFADKDRNVFVAVVDAERVAYKFGWNLADARPSFNNFFLIRRIEHLNFFQKFLIDVRTFFCTAVGHNYKLQITRF